ncbi:peptide deformylase [Agromyces sp. CFH 90414]|uniref:Peptide deformylase n=1 Tax=Agromyces agglutinans TaxID=2662258 RepID=A0A6I2F3J2_9MICO|nr:peptide deformylase [Agromyces agglutinans]MRG58277.1 peptide deformylase [Agromyces agglutinans]
MAVRAIRITGDPVLHSPAAPVRDIDQGVRELVADLFDTMDRAPGVGLAAPQVGVPLRIFTFGWTDEADRLWRGVAINPELWISPPPPGEPDIDEEEGCLSFPGERFGLRRAEHAILRATNLEGEKYEIEASGWLARIFQHEYDHLDGVLYTDRLDVRDQRIVQKITKKLGWGRPGQQWLPGVDDLEA